jgi:uncharacterized membrane protein (UPF0127 family)
MNKQKTVLVFAVIIFVLITASVLLPKQNNDAGQVCFKKNCFSAELALNEKQRETGLMNRASLDLDKGMLFVFGKENIYPFWMKNTLIPLDIIWINSSNDVVYIERNAEPCKTEQCPPYTPNKKAKYVFEINGGLSDKLGIKEGDNASINNA